MPAVVTKKSTPNAGVQVYSFATVPEDTTTSSLYVGCAERAVVHAFGTFAAGNASLQGSIDGTNWAILLDVLGNALTFTAAGIKELGMIPPYLRVLTNNAGDGTTSITLLVATRD